MPDLSDMLTQQQFDAVAAAVDAYDEMATAAAAAGRYDESDEYMAIAQQLNSIIGGRTPE